MLDHICETPLMEKTRYKIPYGGLVFEVDEFFGENAGLVVAKVKLRDEKQKVDLPGLDRRRGLRGPAVSQISNLIRHPYTKW